MNPSKIPSRDFSAFDDAWRALGKAQEALDLAMLRVARAFKLAQLGPSPQPWPERLKHGYAGNAPEPRAQFCGFDLVARQFTVHELLALQEQGMVLTDAEAERVDTWRAQQRAQAALDDDGA